MKFDYINIFREILYGSLLELAFSNGPRNYFGFRIVPFYYYVILYSTLPLTSICWTLFFLLSFGKVISRRVPLIIHFKYNIQKFFIESYYFENIIFNMFLLLSHYICVCVFIYMYIYVCMCARGVLFHYKLPYNKN